MELSIRPRCESGTSRAPGASGAAASPESPWRAVKIGSIQRDSFCPSDFSTYANVVLNIHYSFPLTATPERMHSLHSDGHSTQLSRTKSVSFHFPFYFFESEKKPPSLQLDSHLFFSSSHWTPWLVDEGFRGPCAQTTQRKPVLEGTQVTLAARHLSQTNAFSIFFFSGLNLRERLWKYLTHSSVLFIYLFFSSFLSGQNNFAPTDEMCHMSSRSKRRQVQRGGCAPPRRVTALSSFPGHPKTKCIWVPSMQRGDPTPPKLRFIFPKVNLTSSHLFFFPQKKKSH